MLTREEIRALENLKHDSDTSKYSVDPQGQLRAAEHSLREMGVDDRRPGQAIDIGAGFGYYVRVLRDWGWDAVALNPPTNGIYKAATAILGVPHTEHTITEDCALPDGIGMADLILMLHVNAFLWNSDMCDQIIILTKRLHSHLRPGGLLIVQPNRGELSKAWTREIDWNAVFPLDHMSIIDDTEFRLEKRA